MSTYSPGDLLHQWSISELTTEQIIGHLLQNLVILGQRLTEQEKRIRQLEQSLAAKA